MVRPPTVDLRTARHAPASGVDQLLARLRKIEGQTRGLQAMIERGEPCISVLDQIASVQGALHGVAVVLVERHLRNSLSPVDPGHDDAYDTALTELMRSVARLVRT